MQGDPHLQQQTDDGTQHTTPISPQSTDAHHGRDDIQSQQHRRPAGNSEQEMLPAAGDDGVSQFDIDGGISRAEKLRSGGWGKAKSRRRIESAAASSAWKAHGVSRRPPSPSQPRDPPIACLPVEGLAAIFARLHPEALKTCALVCKAWSILVQDDLTWKAALLYHFGVAEGALLSKAPGRRIASTSWRAEYTVRHELVQRWSKSKTSTIVHDPRIGNITCFNAAIALKRLSSTSTTGSAGKGTSSPRNTDSNPHGTAPSMVCVSVPRGHASRSDPFNGKVAKGGFIDGAPNNAAIPGLEVVSCATVSADGALLAWGMGDGAVTVSRTALGGRGSFAAHAIRGSLPISVGLPSERHLGSVSNLCFVGTSDLLVSVAVDGMVKLWDCFSMVCLWTSASAIFEEHSNRADEGTSLQACAGASSILIAVGTRSAAVHAWRIDAQSWQLRDYQRHIVTQPAASRTVQSLALDPVKAAILVCLDGDSAFYRLDLFDRLESRVIRFGNREGLLSTVTCLKLQVPTSLSPDAQVAVGTGRTLDPSIPVHQSTTAENLGSLAYVIAGDDQGRTFIWDWNSTDRDPVTPFRRMQGFETKVTSIAASDLLAIVGTADGTVRTYDLVSGRLLRVFNDSSAPKHALRQLASGAADRDEAEKWAVGAIQVTADGFVASIGARILAWRLGDEGKGRKKGGQASGRTSSRPERFRSEHDVKRDIQDSTRLLDQEHAEMQMKFRDLRNAQAVAGIPQALGDLTEEEAMAFATMLSQEAEEQRRVEQSLEQSLITEDLDHLQLDEEDSRYNSPGPSTLRYPGQDPGSSPMLQPLSMGRASSPLSPYSRSPSFASSPAQMPQTLPDFEEQATWPLPSPSSGPTAGLARSTDRASATPSMGIWASRAGTTPPSWTHVARRPSSPAFPLLSAEQERRGGVAGAAADEMDEELQFALELSRAEEESRRGIL